MKSPYIFNVRYGFATNSSSTHSIAILNKGVEVKKNRATKNQEFGWNFFTAATEKAKKKWLGHQLKHAFEVVNNLSIEDSAIIASAWCGVKIEPTGYIDHQSIINLPITSEWRFKAIRRDFFDDLMSFILRPDVVVLGGNDNSDHDHPLIESGKASKQTRARWNDDETGSLGLKFFMDQSSSNIRARFDSRGKFWSLFSVSDGSKIRMSFNDDANAEKSEVPELVDIKITDWCDEGCKFCYQNSTPKGEHAKKDMIEHVIVSLAKLETFEVAIGGGEPTSHPNFLQILQCCNDCGVSASFSTRKEDWVVDNWPRLKNLVGAIGLSVDGNTELVKKLSKLKGLKGLKVTVQVVVGSCSNHELIDIMKTCEVFGYTVLFLGWKDVGRGSKAYKYEVDLKKVLESFQAQEGEYKTWHGPSVAFDTVLVKEMESWLVDNSDRWYFTKREGAHSMYIDCVTKKMHISSYNTELFMPLEPTRFGGYDMANHIKDYFTTL